MIAVNPYWGRIQEPFDRVASTLATIAGSPLTLPLTDYAHAWKRGEITSADLQRALAEDSGELTEAQLVAALQSSPQQLVPVPLLSDRLDRQRDLQHQPAWCDTITHQVSQFCAAYFDNEQANWHPDQASDLYPSWRSALSEDHSVALLMRAAHIPARASSLAAGAEQQIRDSLNQLGVPENEWALYLQAVLMRVSGWAAWCAYLRWQARLEGGDSHALIDLLAIRLSWENLVDDGARDAGSLWADWRSEWCQRIQNPDVAAHRIPALWQRAREIAYQRSLADQLIDAPQTEIASTPAVQAAFCIDVRSEVFRRHLEYQSPTIQTLGFAGFFGLPISYTPLGTQATRPQLPGLLAPRFNVTDSAGDTALDARISRDRAHRLQGMQRWRVFQSVPTSAFTLVESLGPGYLGKLIKRSLPSRGGAPANDALGLGASQARAIRPVLDAATAGGLAGQARIAAQVLGAMGLGEHFGRLVMLIGHGSQNRNNPHRAGLDCGACCGQTGEVNARALAALLNDRAVRQQLREAGTDIPDSTCFVAGLHNTTTDEVVLHDVDTVPASHAQDLQWISSQLLAAGAAARRERAPLLGLGKLQDKPAALLRAVRQRADDWAQTRPEWGLANNAAFIIAPRARTRGVDLQGRSFLHDYDHRRDSDGSLLELIMTAPMIVTHWINMQYYASTVDNKRYGSGNKVLHNVVGGRLGVFEGNGGDLRIGLPLQSLHDGEQWRHTPLRLTVVIDAPRQAIERVIAKHETVSRLFDNQWIYLMRLDGDRVEFYRDRAWHPYE
jgi:uncharacterized protein YbcC (UPF0753/DUF2309 family)